MAIQYLIDICKELEASGIDLLNLNTTRQDFTYDSEFNDSYHALVENLLQLDLQDFPPDKRVPFVKLRKFLERAAVPDKLTQISKDKVARIAEMRGLLECYGEDGSRLSTRDLSFISDLDLRKIIARDYHELRVKLFPSGAWKSTVVLAGSILEAVLTYALTSDAQVLVKANAALCAPCNRTTKPKGKLPTDDWTLAELIDVATEINKLPSQHANCIDEVLRGYRNFVHPRREIRAQHACGEPQAFMAVGGLDAVLDFLK